MAGHSGGPDLNRREASQDDPPVAIDLAGSAVVGPLDVEPGFERRPPVEIDDAHVLPERHAAATSSRRSLLRSSSASCIVRVMRISSVMP